MLPSYKKDVQNLFRSDYDFVRVLGNIGGASQKLSSLLQIGQNLLNLACACSTLESTYG
jgi:hypothetical protein